ncbi:MAG: DUF2087 domain-containing protein [Actinomycetota bacterium]
MGVSTTVSRHPDYDLILSKYLKNGRITVWPRLRERRAVLLDYLAQEFDPGTRYREDQVNEILLRFHDDYAMLRRYLVDEGFMERDHGLYWRGGGTWDLE